VRKRALLVAALGLLLAAAPARAGTEAEDEARLRGRLAPEAVSSVLAIVRAARDAGLPTNPLVARALEGASRHVDPTAIVAEVRRHATALADARAALGPSPQPDEIVAGAGALMAGVPADSLAHLRSARASGSLVVSLVVLCDFVARGVPVDAASAAVITATRTGASDEALMRLRERIHSRIEHGAPPAGATQDVLRQWLRSDARASPENSKSRISRSTWTR
jgi:hypothetical protein